MIFSFLFITKIYYNFVVLFVYIIMCKDIYITYY